MPLLAFEEIKMAQEAAPLRVGHIRSRSGLLAADKLAI